MSLVGTVQWAGMSSFKSRLLHQSLEQACKQVCYIFVQSNSSMLNSLLDVSVDPPPDRLVFLPTKLLLLPIPLLLSSPAARVAMLPSRKLLSSALRYNKVYYNY